MALERPDSPVFHIDDARTWRGGEQQVFYLHQGLLARGVDSTVVCRPGSELATRLRDEGSPHLCLPLRGGHDLLSARRLARLAGTRKAILHAHTSHAHDLGLWASRFAGRLPLVVSRRVDFSITGRIAGWKYRNPRVDRYLSISSGVTRELERGGVAPDRIVRVPSGIDFERFTRVEPRTTWRTQLAGDEPLLGNVAALAPHKDQATLLRAFQHYRQQGGRGHLVILGEGDLRSDLEALRAQLDLQNHVHMPGFVDDILGHMASLDVMVMSSELEGLGTSILDAMALGLPVVATRTGGIPDAVLDRETGRLVPPHDPSALGRALLEVMADPQLRANYGSQAKAHVANFDAQRTVELTLAVYRELAA